MKKCNLDWRGKEIKVWIDINKKEIYSSFGLYVYENVYLKSCLTNYWQVNKDQNSNQVKIAILVHCFEQINLFFHIVNPN